MTAQILLLSGGLGLFLFGMLVLTDALRQLSSRQVRGVISRFTKSPLTGAVAGALTTALTQSSSATLVTVIGFVGAGMMTFAQAIGVIYGANIGSTMMGWIVAIVGLKFQLGAVAMPLLLLSVLLHLAGKGRWSRIGLMLAGFSIVFIGLDMMQQAVDGAESWLTPDRLPPDTLIGRLWLVAAGLVLTVVIQSSGAGMAAVLVLLSAGSVTLAQAVALVIGMKVGTTFTGILAALGGTADMKRTALAHTVFSALIGALGFVSMGFVVPVLSSLMPAEDPLVLVVFFTALSVVAMLLMLPVTEPFARMIGRLIPGGGPSLTAALHTHLLRDPQAAMDATLSSANAIAGALFATLGTNLHPEARTIHSAAPTLRLEQALDEVREYLARIQIPADDPQARNRYAALLHLIDHLGRLAHQLMAEAHMMPLLGDPVLRRPARALGAAARRASIEGAGMNAAEMQRLEQLIKGRTATLRRSALMRERVGLVSAAGVFDLTASMRWLHRTAHNAARILHYREQAASETPEQSLADRLEVHDDETPTP
ncbi:Na/Pi symporter [Pararhodobacter sp.]|uniref:Na/Pi cotransporter family protein n=1 Tax=Pararhodobacter sp. TaxID=2127056 RepID=UPI002AFF29DA|nr:Na/Pi symporter [Pararhodobacter sp.]